MNVLIVYAHQDPASFNAALVDRAKVELGRLGHIVEVSDLYGQAFNPVASASDFPKGRLRNDRFRYQEEQLAAGSGRNLSPDIRAEQDKLERADAVIFQFPIWWFSMPAIMRGWVDRVFSMGWAYGGEHGIYDRAGLKGRRAMLSLTTGGPETMWTETGINGRIDEILYPLNHGVLAFVGFEVLTPFIAWQPARVTAESRASYLDAFTVRLASIFIDVPIAYPTVAMFDGSWRLKSELLQMAGAPSL